MHLIFYCYIFPGTIKIVICCVFRQSTSCIIMSLICYVSSVIIHNQTKYFFMEILCLNSVIMILDFPQSDSVCIIE